MPKIAVSDNEILNCFEVMSELRPHLVRDEFLSLIRSMEKEGFLLAFHKHEGEVVSVAGYRISTNLYSGKNLYVDDLITRSVSRSMDYGKIMVDWLRNIAKENSCKCFHLDSGTHRGSAHKFYFKQGFTISCYHFSQSI